MNKANIKKPLYKKWWFWVVAVLALSFMYGTIQIMTGTYPIDTVEFSTSTTESPVAQEPGKESALVEAEVPSEETLAETEPSEEAESTALAFDPALGKDIDDLTWYGPGSVNNDVTGKWYLARVNGAGEMVDYALSYYLKYFGSEDEVHFLVNFSTDTTTRLNYAAGMLFVSTYEHEDGEENDAKVMPAGMLLGSYIVDVKTGEIEDVTNAD